MGKSENAEGVKEVTVKAGTQCPSLLAFLADNGSANKAEEARLSAKQNSELGTIFTRPYHPWTNGHLEGLFGSFSKAVGEIEIDDTNRHTLAQSIVEVVWRAFEYFHNNSPRKRLGGKSPIEYLRTYAVLPADLAKARKGLKAQKKRSERKRISSERLQDPPFRALVARIVKEHKFKDVELDHALKSLVHFDTSVIEGASSSFFAQSKREGFEESKRSFAYFMGIVRNKQRRLDQSRRNAQADVLNARRIIDENRRQEELIDGEERKELEELRTQPQAVVMRYARLLMKGRFKRLRNLCLEGIRKALRALFRVGKTKSQIFEALKLSVQALAEFSEEIKERMIALLFEEVRKLA